MMREIKAIIRRERVAHVLGALHARSDLPGVTISLVEGVGQTLGDADSVQFGEVGMAKLETVVSADLVDWIVENIQQAAFTGRPGDGRIFVIPVEQAVQIRSGKKGAGAL